MVIIDLDTIDFMIVFLSICIALYVIKRKFFSSKTKFWVCIAFVFYLLSIVEYVIFPIFIFKGDSLKEIYGGADFGINSFIQLIPGKTIMEYLQSGNIYQILGNIILLIPFVLFMFIFLQEKKPLYIVLVGSIISALIELFQLTVDLLTKYPNRICDVDDLILNISGVILATVIFHFLKRVKGIQNIYYKYAKIN